MEEDKKRTLHQECPTSKLNLNVPLLSTRRPFGDKMLMLAPAHATTSTTTTTTTDPANMVPFSWERIPGEPKDDRNLAKNLDIVETPPPKLPPGQWQPTATKEANRGTVNQCECCDDDNTNCSIGDCGEQGHQGYGYGYGHSERFSDAIDIFSLGESTDDMEEDCRGATADEERSRSRSSALLTEAASSINGYHSPNFMIQRFLPDAQALAEESVINKTRLPLNSNSGAVSIRRSYHQTPKLGCGLGSFFSWRMKPKPCSVKSPVCDTIIASPNHKQNHR